MRPRKIRTARIKSRHQDEKIRTRLNVTLYVHFLTSSSIIS